MNNLDKLELAVDARSRTPVTIDVGPVLHPDDAVANKMGALFGRAEARDFLDVDAAIQSGQYTKAQLLDLAMAADPGFTISMFAEALGALRQITDAEFESYGTSTGQLAELRGRFAAWRLELQANA